MAQFEGRLSDAPVVYVLCQIRFSAIEKLADYIPSIQDRLRTEFPIFDRQEMAGISLLTGAPPQLQTATRWVFANRTQDAGFLLSTNGLVSHTTKYRDFEHFLKLTLSGFEALHAVARVGVIQRLGLRYIDLVSAAEGDDVEQYLEASLNGFSPKIAGIDLHSNQQVVSMRTAQNGSLILKASRGVHPHEVPIDLVGHGLNALRMPPPEAPSIILDTDHYVDSLNLDPDVEVLEEKLRALHRPISQIFKAVVTDYAVQRWRKN